MKKTNTQGFLSMVAIISLAIVLLGGGYAIYQSASTNNTDNASTTDATINIDTRGDGTPEDNRTDESNQFLNNTSTINGNADVIIDTRGDGTPEDGHIPGEDETGYIKDDGDDDDNSGSGKGR